MKHVGQGERHEVRNRQLRRRTYLSNILSRLCQEKYFVFLLVRFAGSKVAPLFRDGSILGSTDLRHYLASDQLILFRVVLGDPDLAVPRTRLACFKAESFANLGQA